MSEALERPEERARTGAPARRPTVAIVQPRLAHYRLPFFAGLRERLGAHGVRLRLLHGLPTLPEEAAYREAGLLTQLPWAEPFQERRLPFGFVWQPVPLDVLEADLIVVEGASRPLLNYALLLARGLGGPKIAMWGHGWNHQAARLGAGDKVKLWLGRRCDAYFAYTESIAARLLEFGYERGRVIAVQNTLAKMEAPTAIDLQHARAELRLDGSEKVALFCGRMYAEKQLESLIEAARLARSQVPSLILIFAGAGPGEDVARDAARRYDFVRHVGAVSGKRKAAIFELARFVVAPGLVGLVIVDAFHAGRPLLTTRYKGHSPEISYLSAGANGLVVDDRPEALAEGLVRLATDDVLLAELCAGAEATSARLGMDEMVRRFTEGILRVLAPSAR